MEEIIMSYFYDEELSKYYKRYAVQMENFVTDAFKNLKAEDTTVYDHTYPCSITEKMIPYIKKEIEKYEKNRN
jgi:hypothetical protein